MGDSILSSMGFNRSNLNQDIARVVAEQGKLNYRQVLDSCYPARPLTPLRYKESHLKARRVKCIFVGPNDKIPGRCPRGFDLLAVMGLGFTRRETEDVSQLLEEAKVGSSVILGVPEQPLPGSAQLKELQALNILASQESYILPGNAQNLLQSRRQLVRRQLVEKLRPQLTPNNFRWVYKGAPYEGAKSERRDIFFTDVLEYIYKKAPHLKASGSMRDRCEAVDILLNIKEPLQFIVLDKSGGYKVIRDFLLKGGVLSATEDCGSYASYKVNGFIEEKAPLASIWNRLLYMLIGQGREECNCGLSELYAKFSKRPYGIDVSFLNILLAAALRRYYPSLSIKVDQEELPLDSTALRQAWGKAAYCRVIYTPQAPYQSAQALYHIIDTFGYVDSCHIRDLWEIAADSLRAWHDNLSPLVRTLEVKEGEPAYVLHNLFSSSDRISARELISQGLIEAAGFSGLPEGEELERFSQWLDEARLAFTRYQDKFRRRLAGRIAEQFGGQAEALPERAEEYVPILNQLFRRWFSRLYPNSGSQKLSQWASALTEMYALEPEADAQYWFELLPWQFDLPSLSKWDKDNSQTFSSRLVRACLELELWSIEGLLPLPEDKEEAEQKLSHWLRSSFNGFGLNQEERGSVLLDLLEELCWSK